MRGNAFRGRVLLRCELPGPDGCYGDLEIVRSPTASPSECHERGRAGGRFEPRGVDAAVGLWLENEARH